VAALSRGRGDGEFWGLGMGWLGEGGGLVIRWRKRRIVRRLGRRLEGW